MNEILHSGPGAWAVTVSLAVSTMTVSCKPKRAHKNPMPGLTPATVLGFTARNRGRTVNRKTVFDVLNGGAEVYLDYGFKKLYVREYVKKRSGKVTLYLFDMGRARDAFGIFTHEQEGKGVDIGQDSDYEAGLLRFWKGRYFVSIFSARQTGPVREAMLSLGRTVADRIKRTGRRPGIIKYLPAAGRQPRSLRYLHTLQTLSHHLSVGGSNPLGLNRSTEVVTAAYGSGKTRTRALVVIYGDRTRAAGALQKLRELPAGKAPAHARTCGRTLAAVFSTAPVPGAVALYKQVVQRIPECKHE